MLNFKKAISLIIFVCFVFPSLVVADEVVRAKIGIKIIKDKNKNSGRKAGSRKNSLSPDESLMIHVTPESDAFVYIVNSNKNGAELLNPNEHLVKKGQTRIFPTPNASYKPDGKNEEFISVITSAREQPKIKTLFASVSVSYANWQKLEDDLLKNKPRIEPEKPSDRIKDMGGVVRGLGIPTSSGRGWIVKRYQFNVKK